MKIPKKISSNIDRRQKISNGFFQDVELNNGDDEKLTVFENDFAFNEDTSESENEENATPKKLNKGQKRKKKEIINENDTDDQNEYSENEEEIDVPSKKKKRDVLPVVNFGKALRRIGSVEDDVYDPKTAEAAKKYELEKLLELEKKFAEQDDDEIFEPKDMDIQRDLSEPVSTAELLAWREKALAKCRYKIGLLSSKILENPEENVGKLALLNEMLKEFRPVLSVTVKKLAAVSLMEIFKDILPSYQIKHHQSEENVKLKKVTLALQNYEKSLLKHYKIYVEKLIKFISVLIKKKGDARIASEQLLGLGRVALNCLCELLLAHPYFNLAPDIAQTLVLYLNNPNQEIRTRVESCISQAFRQDKRGQLTLFIVRQINMLVKTRKNSVFSEVVSVFLALRIKDVNLDREKEKEINDKKLMARKNRALMSRNEKKMKKKLKSLEKELLETKAEENKQEKSKTLTEVTKVIFTIYFRILKKDPTSKLLGATLEGIAKFAHSINLEFYEDLVRILSRLVDSGALGLHQQLLCVQTVFTILSGYGESLNIDPTRFYTHLYKNILSVNAGKTYKEMDIILHTLENVIIRRRKKITQQRSLAFTKRLGTMCLQLLHNGTLACLSIIRSVLLLNPKADILLETDSTVGQGLFMPELDDPEHCNAASSTLYELTALKRHYHPTVRRMADHISKGVPTSGEGCLPPDLSKKSCLELYEEFNPLEMMFKPAIPAPKEYNNNSKPKPHIWHDLVIENRANQALATVHFSKSTNIYQEIKRSLKIKTLNGT